MSGNHQVRFLGEDAAARSHPYPTKPGASIHQDQRFEDFTRMDNGQIERTSRDDIDPDESMFRIETADQELLAV